MSISYASPWCAPLQNIVIQAVQFAEGTEAVFLGSGVNAQLIDCVEITRFDTFEIKSPKGTCLYPVHKDVAKLCRKYGVESTGLIKATAGKAVTNTAVLVTDDISAISKLITVKALGSIVI